MADPARVQYSRVTLLSLALSAVAASMPTAGMPFAIAETSRTLASDSAMAGAIGTAELLAVAIVSVVVPRVTGRTTLRSILLTGAMGAIAANAISLVADTPGMLVVARLAAGTGAGALISSVMIMAARSQQPPVAFAVMTVALACLSTLLPLLMPVAVEVYGLSGIYAIYFVIGALTLPGVAVLTRRLGCSGPEPSAVPSRALGGREWRALTGLGIYFLGYAGIAAFLVDLGLGTGMSLGAVAEILMWANLASIVAPLSVARLAAVSSRGMVALLLLAGICSSGAVIGVQGHPAWFQWGALLYIGLPLIFLPFILSEFARIDPSGRLTASHTAFVLFGGAVAPVLAGLVGDVAGDSALCILFACLLLSGGILLIGECFGGWATGERAGVATLWQQYASGRARPASSRGRSRSTPAEKCTLE